jgi:hypothetical protein
MWERFLAAWCRKMHNEAMWPMHGKYVCRRCLREHQLGWEDVQELSAQPVRAGHTAASASMDACA